jgi:hypothetical protein
VKDGENGGYILYTYMKTKTHCSKREKKGSGRMMEGVSLIKIHYKHICKCHNETPVQSMHNNKNVKQFFKKYSI